nr:hypothetical protein [uncultured Campylobacter sp.]
MAEFINIKGTTDRSCPCGCSNWKEHWERTTGRKFGTCAHRGCTNKAEVGAHVQEKGGGNTAWYIVPLCRSHNHFSVRDLDLCDNRLIVTVR